jgi:cytochrome c biogenesis protein ResB
VGRGSLRHHFLQRQKVEDELSGGSVGIQKASGWAIKHEMRNAKKRKKKIVLGPVPHHHLRRQRPLLSRDYPNQHLPVLREEVARGRLDPSQVNRPHDVQLIASSGELQARLNHEESAYRSWKDPYEE